MNTNELNIRAMLEVMVMLDFTRLCLPAGRESLHEQHKMRITHGNGNANDVCKSQLNGKRVSHLWLAHFHFKVECVSIAALESARFHAGAGTNTDCMLLLLRKEIGGDTAGTVTRNLSVGPVSVQQARSRVCLWVRKDPFHPVGADAVMPIANRCREGRQVSRRMHAVNQDEIIAAGLRFNKRY